MNARDRRTRQEAALLACGEFFRDELQVGPLTERQRAKFQELRDLCFSALGNPSMKEADDIRERYAELTPAPRP